MLTSRWRRGSWPQDGRGFVRLRKEQHFCAKIQWSLSRDSVLIGTLCLFGSWDGEEYALIGSTEWVEEYRVEHLDPPFLAGGDVDVVLRLL